MTINVFKKVTVAVLALAAAVCLALGFSVMPAAFAADEPKPMTVTGVSGGVQDFANRYLVYLEGDVPFEHDGNADPITVSVNGEDKTIYLYNDTEDKKVALLVTYDIAPKEAKNRVVVKKDTVIGGYKIAETVTILLDNGSMSIVVPDVDYPIESIGGGAQDNMSRYLIWLESSVAFGSKNNIDPITVSIDGEDKTLGIYNAKNGNVALLVPYDVVPKASKAEVTVKKGTRLDNYVVAEDVTIVLDNGEFYIKVPEIDFTIVDFGGGTQDNESRYLVWLNGDAAFESAQSPDPIVVSVNGEDKTLKLFNDKDGKALALIVPYEVAPKDGRTEITIKQGTKICNYVVKEEITAILNRGTIKKKVPLKDITFSLQKDMLGDVTSCIQETADLHRYLIRIQTDLDGLTDTMWNGNVCILDEGTENEKEININ